MSFKSILFNFLVRNRHLLHGKLKKESFDFTTSIADYRVRCDTGASRFSRLPKGISIREEQIEGMKCEWMVPEHAAAEKVLLYVHGGGYVVGSCISHRGFASTLASKCTVSVLLYEYRLAPEHPYPAALDDSVNIYLHLLASGINQENIFMAGDSAGGGLCLATLLSLKVRHIALPAGAAVLSPWTDLTCSSDSYKTKNNVSASPLNSWTVFSTYYAGTHTKTLPFISPLFGDLTGLPPIFINSGTEDELYEDGEQFYLKAKAAGVDIRFKAGKGMIHCYPVFAPLFNEATTTLNEMVNFIRNGLKIQ